jgi:hypothetical protein
MCTEAYASLMVELRQDRYTSKTRESQIFEGNRAIRFVCLGDRVYNGADCFLWFLYTYTRAKYQYISTYMMAYHYLMAIHCLFFLSEVTCV